MVDGHGAQSGTRACPRILDEPLRFLGFDAEDGAVGLTLFTTLHLLGASFWGVVVGLGAAGRAPRAQARPASGDRRATGSGTSGSTPAAASFADRNGRSRSPW